MSNDVSHQISQLRQDYGNRAIDPESMVADPIAQFRLWFDEARESQIYEPNAMVLATVAKDGAPSARTVLLKHLDENGFTFFTDQSSRKGQEIAADERVALNFWWDLIHRSVRIEGQAETVSEKVADDYFYSRPLGSRISATASKQSLPIASRKILEDEVATVTDRYGDDGPPRPARWGGYLVRPQVIEFWQGKSNRLHDRVRYQRDAINSNDWLKQRLSP